MASARLLRSATSNTEVQSQATHTVSRSKTIVAYFLRTIARLDPSFFQSLVAPAISDDTTLSQLTLSTQSEPDLSRLDLIKAETPLTSRKIVHMLSCLESKLKLERAYYVAIERLQSAYLMDTPAQISMDNHAMEMLRKREEALTKMALLEQASKIWTSFYIDDDHFFEGDCRYS